jgi:hypothetical protein
VLIVTSAAVSLLLVGLLALAVTPDHTSAPIAGSATVAGPRSLPAAIASSSALSTATVENHLPVVTPIGDEGWAVTTGEAVAGQSGWMDARLPSGEVVEIEIIGEDPAAGLVVVTLPATAATKGYQLAADHPGPTDTVFVNADEPRVVTLDDLVWLDVEEATPVLDGAGALIGLCTGDGGEGTTLMTVDTMPDAPDEPGAGSTVDVETTVPSSIDDDETTVAPSSPGSTVPDSTAVETTAVETTVDSSAPPTTEPTATSSSVLIVTIGR